MTSSCVFFSLVLYRHTLDDISPLLYSFRKFNLIFPDSILLVHDNSGMHSSGISSDISTILKSTTFNYNLTDNIGFGVGHNCNFRFIDDIDNSLFLVINPDVSFEPLPIIDLIEWLALNPSCSCVAPLIFDAFQRVQYSAKHDPTLLSLLLGRFAFLAALPLLSKYSRWHKNLNYNYESDLIHSTYLSGCFLIIPSNYFAKVGGFCDRYFLHLEDADLVRRLSLHGSTLHNPLGQAVHLWARGSHKSLVQTLHLLSSILVYINEWGMRLW